MTAKDVWTAKTAWTIRIGTGYPYFGPPNKKNGFGELGVEVMAVPRAIMQRWIERWWGKEVRYLPPAILMGPRSTRNFGQSMTNQVFIKTRGGWT